MRECDKPENAAHLECEPFMDYCVDFHDYLNCPKRLAGERWFK